MPRPSKGFKLRMDQTGPSSDILRSHASRVNLARVLIGWQLPTHVCQSFTRQIRVYQNEKVSEKVGENRGKFYLSPTVCQRVCRLLLCRSHTPTWVCQHEFANFSLACEGRLRTFALIVSAHPYCTRKFTYHVMHRAPALSTKMNNNREDLCLNLTILDFRWPLLFFSETDFLYNYLHIVQNWTKNQCGKLTKISRFLCTGHGIQPSCGSKARETMVAKYELVLWRTSPVDWINLIGPLKPYLAENISLQGSNCNILEVAATAAFFANEARFTQI